jgi:hypothetical protein
VLVSLPDLDEYIIRHIQYSLGCSLNSITSNALRSTTFSRNPSWPKKKKDYIPYIDQLEKRGAIVRFKRIIPNQADHIGYYPAGTIFHVYP